jgi:hypothetical protein
VESADSTDLMKVVDQKLFDASPGVFGRRGIEDVGAGAQESMPYAGVFDHLVPYELIAGQSDTEAQ